MSEQQPTLAAIRARLAAATPGPWFNNTYSTIFAPPTERGDTCPICSIEADGPGDDLRTPEAQANRELITKAPTDLAYLLGLVERMREELITNEWEDWVNIKHQQEGRCRVCRNWQSKGHAPNCTLAALLKETEE